MEIIMRYEDEEKQKDATENMDVESDVESEVKEEEQEIDCNYEGLTDDELVDKFQEVVFQAGNRALSVLSKEKGVLQEKDQENLKRAREAMEQLGAFRYNIGFAGPQSCGKSSMINAMIGYPLMPTCNLATTCAPVELIYGETVRIIVKDEDKDGKIVFDKRCGDITEEEFEMLKSYACQVMEIAVIENLQLFSDIFIADEGLKPEQIKMDRKDSHQMALLILILFTVYVCQNGKELKANEQKLNRERQKMLSYFGVKEDTVNYRIVIQWDSLLLASGLMITDLPGLGSMAEDKKENGKTIKGHDTITKEAVLRTDTMAFISEPLVLASAVPALETMISNASVKDAVSVNDRIVAIMNKIDTIQGEQQKRTTIDRMLSMMKNAGADMTGRKVWRTSSLCGEYTYKRMDEEMDLSKSYFIQEKIHKLKDDGYDEDEIQDEIPRLLKEQEKGYKNSGIDDLREFFRTSFIGRGKYQKTFSALMSLKTLALESITPKRTFINTNAAFADVDRNVAKEAMKIMQEKVGKPLSDITNSANKLAEKTYDDEKEVIDLFINEAVAQYADAFNNAVNDYRSRIGEIAGKFELTYFGIGNRARVDSGHTHNYNLYTKLLNESEVLSADLTSVNKKYSDILRRCSSKIEDIYQSTQKELVTYQKELSRRLKDCIRDYIGKADEKVIALMERMIPIMCQFVDAEILLMDAKILNLKSDFQTVSDQLANDIINLNDKLTNKIRTLAEGKLNKISGGWFVKKEFLQIDGEDGLKATINNLSLNEVDKKDLEKQISDLGLEQIQVPLMSWYKDADTDINKIVTALTMDITDQFNTLRRELIDNAENKDNEIAKNKELLEKLIEVFENMRGTVQPLVDKVLDLKIASGSTELKGDFFEGMLEA